MIELPVREGLTKSMIALNPERVSYILPGSTDETCLVAVGVERIPVQLSRQKVQHMWEDVMKGSGVTL
ncbi:MAG: hypothetical protein ACXABY_29380 [Candidatus Thorarchaeota archaeon]